MFSNLLSSIEGVEVYAIIALLIFTALFAAVIIFVLKVDKAYITKMENLPLENDTETLTNNER
jgi:hypothetical protein